MKYESSLQILKGCYTEVDLFSIAMEDRVRNIELKLEERCFSIC